MTEPQERVLRNIVDAGGWDSYVRTLDIQNRGRSAGLQIQYLEDAGILESGHCVRLTPHGRQVLEELDLASL